MAIELIILIVFMKINQQQTKLTSIDNNKKYSHSRTHSDNKNTSEFVLQCSCSKKFLLLGEQIQNINSKISIIFDIIQVNPIDAQQKNLRPSVIKHHSHQSTQDNLRATHSEQSFLLDGIQIQQSQTMLSKVSQGLKVPNNLLIGKQVSIIKNKLKEIEDRSDSLMKLKNNFSILTKIIQEMQHRMQQTFSSIRVLQQSNREIRNFQNTSILDNQMKKIGTSGLQSSSKSNYNQRLSFQTSTNSQLTRQQIIKPIYIKEDQGQTKKNIGKKAK